MKNELQEKLFNEKKDGWETVSEEQKSEIFKISQNYMNFLNNAKTEREFIKWL